MKSSLAIDSSEDGSDSTTPNLVYPAAVSVLDKLSVQKKSRSGKYHEGAEKPTKRRKEAIWL